MWPPPNNLLNQSPKKVTAETDFNKALDFEMPPPSPPLNLHELSGPAEGAPLTPKAGNPTKGLETLGKRSVDKGVSVEVLGPGDWAGHRTGFPCLWEVLHMWVPFLAKGQRRESPAPHGRLGGCDPYDAASSALQGSIVQSYPQESSMVLG